MSIDSILKTLGLRKRSLAERVNNKVIAGYQPSQMAKDIVGKVSAKKFNKMMAQACDEYNQKHNTRIFKDG